MRAVGRPASHIVENDGILAVWHAVEFAAAETRRAKLKSAGELVVINRLLFYVTSWCLEDEDADRVSI